MIAPRFWFEGGPLSAALAPLGWAWAAGARLRPLLVSSWRAPVPVICVGNLVAGGAGKTPVAIDLATRLPGWHLIARGHGGREIGPHRVDPAADDAARVGDEPLLLAAAAPCWVTRDRVAGARAAIGAGARGLILDDGFQDPALVQDLPLLVIDGESGFGAGRCIPAGPLREPVATGSARARAAILIGADKAGIAARWHGPPLLRARLVPDPAAASALAGRRVLAFAGIGRPAKFFATLATLGAEVVETRAFPDHHPYSGAELAALRTAAADRALLPVTTAKDWARLAPEERGGLAVLPVTLAWNDPAGVEALLTPFRAAGAG